MRLRRGPRGGDVGPTWNPETGQVHLDDALPFDAVIHLAAVFVGVPNTLDVLAVDLATVPPTVTPDPVATGNIFALGTMDVNETVTGFSFVDGSFDLRYALCENPCVDFTSQLVAAGTLVDSASAASADYHFVAALGNGVPRTLGVSYSADGVDWTSLYSYTPPETGGVCGQYNGCGRISFVVDPTATTVADTLSCLTFEVKTSATTTERRVICFLGSLPQFVMPIDTDVPYAAPVLDRVTDSELNMALYDIVHRPINGAYNHRQTNTVRAFQFNPTTLALAGPVELGPAPAGSDAFGLAGVPLEGGAYRVVWAAPGPGLSANDVEWDPATSRQLLRVPFWNRWRQVELQRQEDLQAPGELFMHAFLSLAGSRFGPVPEVGLALSSYRLPFFDDGFETDNLVRWSATSP